MPNRKNYGILICVGERYEILKHPIRGSVGTGRRARLRILWWLHRVGSSPIFRTKDSGRKTWVFLHYKEISDRCGEPWRLAWWYQSCRTEVWMCILRKISCEMSHGEKEERLRWTPEDNAILGIWGKSRRKRDRNYLWKMTVEDVLWDMAAEIMVWYLWDGTCCEDDFFGGSWLCHEIEYSTNWAK